jgi:hypothetical protein
MADPVRAVHNDDDFDLAIHGDIDDFVDDLARDYGMSRRETLERLIGFVENDDDAPPKMDTALAEMVLARMRSGE